jgi:hypothetical protein
MRRVAIVLTVVWGAVGVGRVDAHVCATPVAVDVDEPVQVPVGVGAEAVAVTGVDIEVPAGFRLSGVRPLPGWTTGGDPPRIEFRGSTIPPFGCGSFTLSGTATRRDVLAFPITVHTADGATARLDGREPGSADSAQLVYAGLKRAPIERGAPIGVIVGIGLVLVGASGAAVHLVRRRRSAQ